MSKKRRQKTDYPGVYFEMVPARSNPRKREKSFMISYRLKGKLYEERVGRESHPDKMTPARAFAKRQNILEGKDKPARLKKEEEEAEKANSLTSIWSLYLEDRGSDLKGAYTDNNRFELWIKPYLGSKRLDEIKPLDVSRIVRAMKKAGRKPQTIRHTTNLIVRISNFARRKQLASGLTFLVEHPKVDNRVTEKMTPEQLAAFVQACNNEIENPDMARLALLALHTGMRRGALTRLEWRDIDFNRNTIILRDAKGGTTKSILVSQAALKILEDQPKYDNSDLVFPNPKTGKRRVDLRKTINKLTAKAGLPKTWRGLHGLRHVFGQLLADEGVDPLTIQNALTHADQRVTQRYLEASDKRHKNAAEIVEKAINGN